ncbi:MAG: sulfite exporter TauE/SafE family protein [Actinomycetota bacterium]|nr:sulfite exporter TauE/SafE family protein [Actinomycetota bacterium]
MDILLACLLCVIGGIIGGLIGVGGGVIFVPTMTIVLGMGQINALSTSLMMIALVSIVGAWRQHGYGNVRWKDAAIIGLLSPVGVLIGVVIANAVPERALRIGFALLALYMAYRLLLRVFRDDGPPAPADTAAPEPGPAGS